MPVSNPYAVPSAESLVAPAVQLPTTPTPESFTPPAPVAAPSPGSFTPPQPYAAPIPESLAAPAPTGGFLCTFFAISCPSTSLGAFGEPEVIEEPVIEKQPSSDGGFLCSLFGISCPSTSLGAFGEPEVIEPYAEPTRESIFKSSDAGIPPQQQGIYDQGQFTSPAGYPPADEGSISSPDALPGGIPTSVNTEVPPAPLGLPQIAPPPVPSSLPSGHPAAQTSPPSHPVWMPQEQILTISPEFAPDLPWLKTSTTCGSAGVSWAIQQCPAYVDVLLNPSPAGRPGLKIMTSVPDSLDEQIQQKEYLDRLREETGREIEVVPGVPPDEGFVLHGAGEDQCHDGRDNNEDGVVDIQDPGCVDDVRTEGTRGFGVSQCNDGRDNNDDAVIDLQDPGCLGDGKLEGTRGFGISQCNDLRDNNDDGAIDGEDRSCPPANPVGKIERGLSR